MTFGQMLGVDPDLAAAMERWRRLRPLLGRVLAVLNGKGGQGKTSVSANLGGLLALAAEQANSRRRVLLVDCDPQGNLGLDLGYLKPEDVPIDGRLPEGVQVGDDGKGLMTALQAGTVPHRLRNVRPWLDVIPGGSALDEVNGMIFGKTARGHAHQARLALAEVLATIADEYDWIIIDCPPREINLQDLVLVASRAALVPVSFDQASRQGLSGVAERFGRATTINEELELLGVAMFGFQYRVNRKGDEVGQRREVRRELKEDLRAAGTDALVFNSVIRYMPSVAKACRDRGQLMHELEQVEGPKWWEIRAGTAKGRPVPSSEAGKVAQEYEDLAGEVFTRFSQLGGEHK
ncbi:ParA family protein [Salinispora mooreana]|uniref:ParA family protein n=1 Tax=Salinispora mooreana TaxID=999545 RepID=UPI000365FEDF|nr:ParA family protein [Salinispora mooreana]